MITFMVEKFQDVYGEVLPLLHEHYAEISTHKDHGIPLEPQEDVYLQREREGSLFVGIGREAGKVVAYYACFIAPGLHYAGCLTSLPDVFYVEPGHRYGGYIGSKLFDFVEVEFRRRRVRRWAVGTKVKHDASALFRRKEFEPVETIWEKWLHYDDEAEKVGG